MDNSTAYMLDAREQAEQHFAKVYVEAYNHGTDGHTRLTVIYKLTKQIEVLQQELARVRLELAGEAKNPFMD